MYLCRFDQSRCAPILKVPGIVNVVSFGGLPTPISESEIAAVRALSTSNLIFGPWPFMEVGQRVLIHKGPLEGKEGFLIKFRGGYRLVVSITMLNRSVAAEIERDWVRPISNWQPQWVGGSLPTRDC